MNHTIFWRLVWKEYRVQRAFWIAMAVVTLFLQWIAPTLVRGDADRINVLFYLALLLPAFYALGCGATLFATEHETGTYQFQRALPVSAPRLFYGKLACAVVSTLAMIGIFWLLAVIFAGRRLPQPGAHHLAWGVFGLAAVELLAWGMLFSLLLKRPLTAALLAVTAASTSIFFVSSLVAPGPGLEPYLAVLHYRTAMVVAVALVDLWLGYRWLRDATVGLPGLRGLRRRAAVKHDAVVLARAAASPGSAVLGRLLWQQWRQSARLLATFAAISAPILALGVWTSAMRWAGGGVRSLGPMQFFLRALTMLMAMVAGPLLASCTFLADQQGYSFRFLAERGVRPRYVWLSRQLVWMPAVLLWALALCFAFMLVEGSPLEGDVFAVLMGVTVLAYSCGQICSIFFRSGILAGFFTLVSLGVFWCWAMLMYFWGLDPVLLVAPIPPVLLLATWLRAPDWLRERNSFRAWLRPGGVLLVSAAALLTAVPLVRVYEIPLVDPGFSPEEYARASTPEERATVDLYRRAAERLVPIKAAARDEDAQPNGSGHGPPEKLSTEEIAWVEANRQSIALTVAASQRKACDFFDPIGRQGRLDLVQDCRSLGPLLVASARRLEAQGRLDAALERYLATLRLSAHLRRRSSLVGSINTDVMEHAVYDRLPFWAAHPDQTPQRIREALGRIDKLIQNVPSRSDPIKCEYLLARKLISADPDTLAAAGVDEDVASLMRLWARWLPWERARALRMLNYFTRSNLQMLHLLESAARQGERIAPVGDEFAGHREPEFALRGEIRLPVLSYRYGIYGIWHLTTNLVRIETRRRATRLQLAIEAWKAAHSRLPDTLDEVVQPYLGEMPMDPFSGEPFRYFREGLPTAISFSGPYHGESQLEAGTPFVWSTGTKVYVFRSEKGVLDRYRINFKPGGGRAESEIEVWQAGWLFPLP